MRVEVSHVAWRSSWFPDHTCLNDCIIGFCRLRQSSPQLCFAFVRVFLHLLVEPSAPSGQSSVPTSFMRCYLKNVTHDAVICCSISLSDGLKCKGGTPWQHLCSVEPRSGLGPWDQTQDSQFVHAYWSFLMKLVGTDHCPHGADGSASYYRNTRKWKIQLWWWPSKPALKLMHHPRSKTMQKHCKNWCFWHRWSKNIVKVHNFATGPSKTLKKPVVFDTDGPKSL